MRVQGPSRTYDTLGPQIPRALEEMRRSVAAAARRAMVRPRRMSSSSGPVLSSHAAYVERSRGSPTAVNDPASVMDGYDAEAVAAAHAELYGGKDSPFADSPGEPGALSADLPASSRLPATTATTATALPEVAAAVEEALAGMGVDARDPEELVREEWPWPEDSRGWDELTAAEKAGYRPRAFGLTWEAHSLPALAGAEKQGDQGKGMTRLLDALKQLVQSPPAHFTEHNRDQVRQLYQSALREDVVVPDQFPAHWEWMRDLNYVRELRPHVSRATAAARHRAHNQVLDAVDLPEGIPESRRSVAMPILSRIATHPKFSAEQKAEMLSTLRLALSRLDSSDKAASFREAEELPDLGAAAGDGDGREPRA